MRLVQLFESSDKSIAFCFGRMNPPTIGHGAVFDTLASVNRNYRIYVSPAQTPKKKNPLDFNTKIKFLKEMFPQHATHISTDPSLNTIMKIAVSLYNEGYRKVTVVTGSDRIADFEKLLTQYNGVESAHGMYDFSSIKFASSGDRDPDSDGVAGASGTAARAAAAAGDEEKFAAITGAGKHAKELFAAVRASLKIKEDFGGAPAGVGIITKQNTTKDVNKGTIGKNLKAFGLTRKAKKVSEAPIELDREDPMNPMIYGHDKANPAKLKYRMMRAAAQIKDLASRVDNAGSHDWDLMTRQFEELKMNMEQIRHGIEELKKIRSKGGIRSRGITI
jgi:phosphopantetheine adenylyltransferase